MMEYNVLTQVKFQHTYYKKGQLQQMDLMPTAATQRLCKQYRCMFRKEEQTYHILYGKEANKSSFLSEEKETLRFTFLLKMSDPTFENYTEIPLHRLNTHKFYFNLSNFEKTTDALLEKRVSAANQMPFYPKAFEYKIADKTKATGELILKNEAGTIVLTQTLDDANQSLFFDLTDTADGCYNCFLNNEKIDRFYSGQNLSPTCFGILDFTIKPATYLGDEANFKPRTHSINFQNRATFWRYHIINANGQNYSNYRITNEKNQIDFSDKGTVKLSNGQEASLLVSQEQIPLQGVYASYFKLHMQRMINGQANKKIDFILLPHADIAQIKPIRQANNSVLIYSDIYVYL